MNWENNIIVISKVEIRQFSHDEEVKQSETL